MRSTMTALGLMAVGLALVLYLGFSDNSQGAEVGETKVASEVHENDGLPDAVRAAVTERYPGRRVEDMEVERRIVRVWEVEVEVDGVEYELLVSEDGQIVETSQDVAEAAVPEDVMAALKAMAPNGKVRDMERSERLATLGWLSLEQPMVVYEAESRVNGRKVEYLVQVDAQGNLVVQERDADRGDEADDDDRDEDDD